ncbi:hypothetical protein U1Q18_020527 [Sarracenia purpurea var. burkii]
MRERQLQEPPPSKRTTTKPPRENSSSSSRKSFLLLLITITIASLLSHSAVAVVAVKDDAAVMSKLANSLTPSPSGWSRSDPCNWPGVACDSSGHVTSISLASKSLGGKLPAELNQLSQLKSLSLQRNQLSGPFPPLADLPSLQQVFLDSNNFTSVPSPFLTGLTSLQVLSLAGNQNLSPWALPESLSDSTALTTLYAGQSNLVGTIPDIFGSFPDLQNLRLSYNNLTGPLPPSFAKSPIQNLWLNNQELGLSGRLDVLDSMSQLKQVWLHQNQFSGSIPNLSECASLFDLSLRDNDLTGPVPASLTTLPKLVNVSLQNNKLQGPMPSFPSGVEVNLGNTNSFCNPKPTPCDPQVTTLLEIVADLGYPMVLAESWTGNNPCDDWKSVSCDANGSVTVINFAKQGWSGTMSPAIANLTALMTLAFNDNNLTGPIPPGLTKLAQLRLLDVSNNNISGQIPAFGSGVTVKTSGNPFLEKEVATGDGISSNNSSPSGMSGSPSGGTSSSSSSGTSSSPSGGTSGSSGGTGTAEAHKSSFSPWVIAVAIVAAVVFIALLSLLFYKFSVRKQKRVKGSRKTNKESRKNGFGGSVGSELRDQGSGDNNNGMQVHDGGNGNVAIPIEVLREATDNFSEYNILGQGGFGVVYSGRLNDGTQIAVKRMESATAMSSSKGLSEFQAEIAVLSRVRHRHLVALHGFCINGNERLLVYEYMPQGTLGQHLFGYREMGIPPLTWKQRVTIALDVARGVEYLHGLAQQSFIHRDLKPSNILLGDDMRAKVSDFGLVKNAPDGKYSVETKLAGTFGYLAPEYASTGRVTTKVDVFAFGVVLMEIITGRKVIDESLPEEKSHLVTWFRRWLNDKDAIRKFLDPSLDPDEETFQSICRVTEVAGHCTARDPHQRPDMGHVVMILSPLVEKWKPASATHHEEESESFGNGFPISLPQAIQRWQASTDTTYRITGDYTSTQPSGIASTFNSKDGRAKGLEREHRRRRWRPDKRELRRKAHAKCRHRRGGEKTTVLRNLVAIDLEEVEKCGSSGEAVDGERSKKRLDLWFSASATSKGSGSKP